MMRYRVQLWLASLTIWRLKFTIPFLIRCLKVVRLQVKIPKTILHVHEFIVQLVGLNMFKWYVCMLAPY